MRDKENLIWTTIAFVVGATITVLYDMLKELFLNMKYSNIDSIAYAGLISIVFGLGFLALYATLPKSRRTKKPETKDE